jgi:hypothetical protein
VLPFQFHPLAQRELFEATDFYTQRAPGLGAEFLSAIETTM